MRLNIRFVLPALVTLAVALSLSACSIASSGLDIVVDDIATLPDSGTMAKALMPWVLLAVAIALTGVYLFTLPMEMRGTVGLGH